MCIRDRFQSEDMSGDELMRYLYLAAALRNFFYNHVEHDLSLIHISVWMQWAAGVACGRLLSQVEIVLGAAIIFHPSAHGV